MILARRRLPWWILLPGTLALVVAVALGWYLVSPLFLRTRTVEESPFTVLTEPGIPGSAAQSRAPSGPEPSGQGAAELTPGARILGTGMFADRDRLHRGSGQAILGRMADGTHYLRFESFSITNGPDLHVFLSRAAHPTTHDEVYDGIYVGKLKAPEGAFNYELPPGADISSLKSAVVYCVPFRVIFTSAPLTQT